MNKIILQMSMLFFLISCGSKTDPVADSDVRNPRPPVRVTHVSLGQIHKQLEFNAYSSYLKKEIVRAPISGYLQEVGVSQGDRVKKGQILFTMQTQEARALKELTLKNDSLPGMNGEIDITAPQDAIIGGINYQKGAYVTQGEKLAEARILSSMVFIMNVPYENVDKIHKGMPLDVLLPGDKILPATLKGPFLSTGVSNQVQSYILKTDTALLLPERLNVTIKANIEIKQNVQRLNKQAILTNETQTSYWIMLLVNDTTAVRTNIKKGLEEDSLVEIVAPHFDNGDRILLEGQYGLPDTAYVQVTKR